MTTQLSLTTNLLLLLLLLSFAAMSTASSRQFKTRCKYVAGRRVNVANNSGCSVSSDTLRLVNPAWYSARNLLLLLPKTIPLVVIPIEWGCNWCSPSTMVHKSCRSVGSPPVKRNFVTPNCRKCRASCRSSAVVNKCDGCCNGTPCSGMQYVQRKLQRSVNDSLKYVW